MVSDKIRQIMKEKGIMYKELAEHMGIKGQALTNRFMRDKWSVQDLIFVLDFLDCQLVIEEKPNVKIVFSADDIKDCHISN